MTAIVGHRRRLQLSGRAWVLLLAALLLATSAAALSAALPPERAFLLHFLVGGPAVLGLLVASQKARVLWVVVGGVAALQSSQELDVIKLTYLAGVGASAGIAILALSELRSLAARDILAPIFKLSVLLVATLLSSATISLVQGTSPTAVLRDIAPFMLFALTPVFAVEANAAFSKGQLAGLIVVLGLLSSASFAVEWLDRRHFLELPFDRIALPSFLPAVALFSYAVSAILSGKGHRRLWELVGTIAVASMLVTGTRSGLIMLLAVPVIVAAMRGPTFGKTARLAGLGARQVVVILVAVLAFASLTGFDARAPVDRILSLPDAFGGSSAGQSYEQRRVQTDVAWQRFSDSPVFGGGPGRTFQWVTQFGPRESFNIDSPLSFPAKFGIVGTAILGAVLLGYIRLARLARGDQEQAAAAAALLGYMAVILASSLLISPLEDKGATFGLLLLLASCLPSGDPPTTARASSAGDTFG